MWTVDSLSYSYRKKLTIDHTKVGATLTNFPVLVKLTDSRFDWTHSNSDGFDVRFTASDGTTLLKYERERHDGADYAEYWVKIPSVSSTTDTDFYIYYRTTDTADGADPTNVWDSDFKAVYHLKDDPNTSTCQDSTTNNKDITKKGANEPIEATGKIAKGQQFDGSNDYGEVSGNLLQNASACFIEFWAKISPDNSKECVTGCYKDNNDRWIVYLTDINTTEERLAMGRSISGSWGYIAHTGTNLGKNGLSDGNFHHIFIYFNGSGTGKIYVDGVDKTGLSSAISELPNITTNTTVGDYPDATHKYFKGVLDELRISNVSRSIAFGIASYNSEADTLLTYGAEEESTSTAYTTTCSETLSLSDTISKSTKFNKSITETLSMTEAVSKSKGMSKTLTETISLSDVISSVLQRGLLLLETLHITDTLQKTTRFAKTLTESISLTDTLASAKQFFVNLSETIGLTDAISKSTNFAKTISETLHLTDVIKVTGWFWNYLFKRTSSYDYKSKSKNTWTYKDK